MSDAIIQLPYTGTTSGDLLDAESLTVGANTVKRERMQITGATATLIAPVTSSYGLAVNNLSTATRTVIYSSTPTIVSASSGLIQISGPITSASSGLVQISGTATVVNASSGFVQVYQTTAPWSVSGTVTLSSNPVTGQSVILVASSGGVIPATSSGGLLVALSNASAGSGSTAVNLVGAGTFAPVTSSYGLLAQGTPHRLDTIQTAVGAPVTQTFTSAPAILYSVNIGASAGTSHAVKFYTLTTLTSNASTFFQTQLPASAGTFPFVLSANGVAATGGLYATVTLNATSTGAATAGFSLMVEYAV